MKKFIAETDEGTRIISAIVEAKDMREARVKFSDDFAHDYGYFPVECTIVELQERGDTAFTEIDK